jgi:C-terminal processing protease CtpA/Prc
MKPSGHTPLPQVFDENDSLSDYEDGRNHDKFSDNPPYPDASKRKRTAVPSTTITNSSATRMFESAEEDDPLHDYIVQPPSSSSYNGFASYTVAAEEDVDMNLSIKKYRKMTLEHEHSDSVMIHVRRLPLYGMILMLIIVGVGLFTVTHDGNQLPKHEPNQYKHKGPISDSVPSPPNSMTYEFDPNAYLKMHHDAFHVINTTWYGGIFSEPPHPSIPSHLLQHDNSDDNVGYMQQPQIYNNTLVFCSEGDVYLTQLIHGKLENNVPLPAMRLTSTVGNVGHPTINPKYPYLLAFTATYTGHREVYLMDLRSNHRSRPSLRITYTDSVYGILSISGWEDDGSTLVVSSFNMDVALPDVRLYKIGIIPKEQQETMPTANNYLSHSQHAPITVSSKKAVPLSQAIDSVVDEESNCRFFTRFKQSSNTVRYVGGTAEHLWVYCDSEKEALGLTQDYKGASKAPQIYKMKNGTKYLFFMSDRGDINGTQWKPTTMNLWATLLPSREELYSGNFVFSRPFSITAVSCQYNGMHLQEYSIDTATGNIILRIGADLHVLDSDKIHDAIRSSQNGDVSSKRNPTPFNLPIAVYSDFNNLHERIIPLSNPKDVTTMDCFDSGYGTISALMAARGQLYVNPVITDTQTAEIYRGSGMNMPARRYRVAPGSRTGGSVRIFGSWFLDSISNSLSKMALLLATDPLSPTAELAFYVVEVSSSAKSAFSNIDDFQTPIIGGHVNGGSTHDGGLGSIKVESVAISPCGRRFAWSDTDGNIRIAQLLNSTRCLAVSLPVHNEMNEPLNGIGAALTFSPAGRYAAIEHSAKNQFKIISIADLGDPVLGHINVGRIVQATPSRFNSMKPIWGRAPVDFKVDALYPTSTEFTKATTLYFLTDRDVILVGNTAPWGSRAPGPYFRKASSIYALPLISKDDPMIEDPYEKMFGGGSFAGGGALELLGEHINSWNDELKTRSSAVPSTLPDLGDTHSSFDNNIDKNVDSDVVISFDAEGNNMDFARRAYLVTSIPESNYLFLHQLQDDASLIVAESSGENIIIKVFAMSDFPDNGVTPLIIDSATLSLEDIGVSTNRKFLYFSYSGLTKVIKNNAAEFMSNFVSDIESSSDAFTKNIVDTNEWALSVLPKLEYYQMFSDAWRMLRDYYYTKDMGGVDWVSVHTRFLPLVSRCGKREELDDVLKQMASELSALHVFVYGGEYNDPLHGNPLLRSLNAVASLGASLELSIIWGGYLITDIPAPDPDFNPLDGGYIYSPLSNVTLRLTGQIGLLAGDVIVGVNGESVLNVPDINMLLRGMAGKSVRLDVLRLKSKSSFSDEDNKKTEPVIVVPITSEAAENLRYAAWEWRTRELAKTLAFTHGFTVGYTHLRSMSGAEGEDAFVRGFYPDFDKDAMIIDVRHNNGGNIDSWLLSTLQRKAWMFFKGRATNITTGGLGWDEQFAFRGHVVVLIDQMTSSDGEGFARGVSELGLGKLIGSRTWGGGIWLSSDNRLVDHGIASSPEYGTYNHNFGWGIGIEQLGVEPDIDVDNNPRLAYDGEDQQLEMAMKVLKKWIDEDPILLPSDPGASKDMSLDKSIEACRA